MATIAMVKVFFGQALRWQRADFGLTWYKNDMFLIVSRAVQLNFFLVHIIYISFFHFFYHFDCRRKLYTLMATNKFQMSKFRVTLTNV